MKKKYFGLVIFIIFVILTVFAAVSYLLPKKQEIADKNAEVQTLDVTLAQKRKLKSIVEEKKRKMEESKISAPKKIYTPIESELDNDTLFFTLYNDVIEMVHANAIKINSIDYKYAPANDNFVKHGGDFYFVCDVNMQLISNYVNLGKFIQDVYQYPYYIKFNSLDVKPYPKDKKVLITDISLRLYARTTPDEPEQEAEVSEEPAAENAQPEGATTPLPQ